jgi:ADP-ribose pyrophosphatase YjhB (NUDIX family)
MAGTDMMPMAEASWQSIIRRLSLPVSYTFDIANRKHIPTRVVFGNHTSGARNIGLSLQDLQSLSNTPVGIVFQSPPLIDSFMTFALSFDPSSKMTKGFLGFQMSKEYVTPGLRLLSMIQDVPDQVWDPMLLPALSYGLWTDTLQRDHNRISTNLREVQEKTGLMNDYLRQHRTVEDTVNFDAVHRTLVLQHAYLTNGMADFVLALGPATVKAIEKIEGRFPKDPASTYIYHSEDTREHVDHMQVRAATEFQHRQRMLDRIAMYLQVVRSSL